MNVECKVKMINPNILVFKRLIRPGAYYVGVICNHCLQRSSVTSSFGDAYGTFFDDISSLVSSFHNRCYIYLIFTKELNNSCTLYQVDCNMLER